jgi:hypothetical protein
MQIGIHIAYPAAMEDWRTSSSALSCTDTEDCLQNWAVLACSDASKKWEEAGHAR